MYLCTKFDIFQIKEFVPPNLVHVIYVILKLQIIYIYIYICIQSSHIKILTNVANCMAHNKHLCNYVICCNF